MTMVLRSSIKSALLKKRLIQGSLWACLGAVLLVLSGSFLTTQSLSKWGLPLFFVGIGLIAWGLIPYKMLGRLEKKPNKLTIENDAQLRYFFDDQLRWSIPLNNIAGADYIENGDLYGLRLRFKDSEQKIFIPYFSHFAQDTLRRFLEESL